MNCIPSTQARLSSGVTASGSLRRGLFTLPVRELRRWSLRTGGGICTFIACELRSIVAVNLLVIAILCKSMH